MDAKDLRGIGEILAKQILDNKNIEATIYQLQKVISYLESEQRERKLLTDQMLKLNGELYGSETKTGLSHDVTMIKNQSEKNGKKADKVLIGMTLIVIAEIVKFLFEHIKI